MTQAQQDPRQADPQPPLPEQSQPPPGLEVEMQPKPDYGEETYQGHGRLEGKSAVITGGDSGIGRAVALAFAREGADVVISYLDEHPDAEETVRVVEASGRRCVAVPGDIGEEAHCQSIVRRALDELGRLDVLVNNAAHQMLYPSIQEISSEEWDKTFRTNIY
ncbi:MAG: SDR family NAD(P)-dependent oxidoreductase, partial [Actinomycetota bacterium]|nr:SDR family NAD(P)-dependent oxidoreductase [Actinomycetota bacterium]